MSTIINYNSNNLFNLCTLSMLTVDCSETLSEGQDVIKIILYMLIKRKNLKCYVTQDTVDKIE